MNRDTGIMGPSDTELAALVIDSIADRLRYGATFQTVELREIVGLTQDSKATHLRWLSVCKIIRDRLLEERAMYMRSVGAGSYAIITPEEQAHVAQEDAARGILNELNKANRVIDHTNTDVLTPEQMRRHDDLSADQAQRSQAFRRELRRRRR